MHEICTKKRRILFTLSRWKLGQIDKTSKRYVELVGTGSPYSYGCVAMCTLGRSISMERHFIFRRSQRRNGFLVFFKTNVFHDLLYKYIPFTESEVFRLRNNCGARKQRKHWLIKRRLSTYKLTRNHRPYS